MKVGILKKDNKTEIFFKYNPKIVDCIKKIDGAKYDGLVRKWIIDTEKLIELRSILDENCIIIELKDEHDMSWNEEKQKKKKIGFFKIGNSYEISFKYDTMILDVVRKLKGAKFDGSVKKWIIPQDQLNNLRSSLNENDVEIVEILESNDVIYVGYYEDGFIVRQPIPENLNSKIQIFPKVIQSNSLKFAWHFYLPFNNYCQLLGLKLKIFDE